MTAFVAIDFETANPRRDSACAVGVARCRDGRVEEVRHYLIRPPTREFTFTAIHGITWNDVRAAPTFAGVWPLLAPLLDGAGALYAHNAPFDRSVLRACCATYGLPVPEVPFHCTVRVARAQWDIRPTRLPDVCDRLRIPLRHHDAASDAEACARIALAALAEGWRP